MLSWSYIIRTAHCPGFPPSYLTGHTFSVASPGAPSTPTSACLECTRTQAWGSSLLQLRSLPRKPIPSPALKITCVPNTPKVVSSHQTSPGNSRLMHNCTPSPLAYFFSQLRCSISKTKLLLFPSRSALLESSLCQPMSLPSFQGLRPETLETPQPLSHTAHIQIHWQISSASLVKTAPNPNLLSLSPTRSYL